MKDEKQDVQEVEEQNVPETSSEESSTSNDTVDLDGKNEQAEVQQEKPKKTVPLDALIKERRHRREIQARLDELEQKFTQSSKPDPVQQIKSKLDVDDEVAQKLHELGLAKEEQTVSQEQKLFESFAKRALDVAQDYDDWDDLKPDMESLFADEYKKDPYGALKKDPELYYERAKRLREQKSKESSVREVVDKVNSKNLAGMETAKNSTGKPHKEDGWSVERIKKVKQNGTYEKYRGEILAALRAGRVKK